LAKAHALLAECASDDGKATEGLVEAELGLAHALRTEERIFLSFIAQPIGLPLLVGATPAGVALRRLERLVEELSGDRVAAARASEWVALLLAHLGRFDEARRTARYARGVFEDLGNSWDAANASEFQGNVEWLAGDPAKAEELIGQVCDLFRDGLVGRLPYCVADLADILLSLGGRDATVLELTDEVKSLAGDNFELEMRWRAARSIAIARLGHIDDAIPLIEESERLGRTTDFAYLLADTMLAKAEVLKTADRPAEAAVAAREALALYEMKEFIPHIGWAQSILDSLVN
jgi:tetratricopeptide (TPR) repeat protein